MHRTIHVIAAGVTVICSALAVQPARASESESALVPADDAAPAPLVASHVEIDFAPAAEDARVFLWSSELSLTPPPYVRAEAQTHLAPPSARGTAIPLPAAAWTGFASLGGLGAIALLRRLRHLR